MIVNDVEKKSFHPRDDKKKVQNVFENIAKVQEQKDPMWSTFDF